ncbi:MAG: 4-hydroxybenzoate octaprenyltransferase [Phycisphaerales bacterium]|nr:4-hydroxybenzoate octaprenyltransferase [Phycisphaerales bacterium]
MTVSTPTPSSAAASAPAPSPVRARPGPVGALRMAAGDIKLAHSVFALPFAVLGAFLARDESSPWARFAGQLGLVVVCMVLARTWAMLFNRLADRGIDAANPRTARRVFASGRLSPRAGWAIALGCAALFVAAAWLFDVCFGNPWPARLAVPVLIWIAFYSLTKRFTWLCHVFLGGALAASPIAAAIAVNPPSVGLAGGGLSVEGAGVRTPAVFWLAGMVVMWVAGFDIIYALQDVAFDRATKLWSIPARLGVPPAIWISRVLHAAAVVFLFSAARADPRFGSLFAVGVLAVVGLLVGEHAVLARRGERGLDMAFFTLNGILSCVLGLCGVIDLVF